MNTEATLMAQTMRWLGPSDPVELSEIRQSGATGIVTALHDLPAGAVWTSAAIASRKRMIEEAGLTWTVVGSLHRLAEHDIRVVTYYFMQLLDWTGADLGWRLADNARALRFECEVVAVYHLHILRRIVAAVPDLSAREGRSIPIRPDHGHRILDDHRRRGNPGYPLLGRTQALAELRGLEWGIAHARTSTQTSMGVS